MVDVFLPLIKFLIVSWALALGGGVLFIKRKEEPVKEPIVANYKRGWLVPTLAGDKVRIICILEHEFEEFGEPRYFVQSKKSGRSYHLKESEIKPKAKSHD